MNDFMNVNERVKQIKVVSAEADPGNANKVHVTLEIPYEADKPNDLDQFFGVDAVKQLAIKEASAVTHKPAGWSQLSPLQYMKDGVKVLPTRECDAVRVIVTCLSMP